MEQPDVQQPTKKEIIEGLTKENQELTLKVRQLTKENNVLKQYRALFETADRSLSLMNQVMANYQATATSLVQMTNKGEQ